jgi:transcription initiation factor TFIIB
LNLSQNAIDKGYAILENKHEKEGLDGNSKQLAAGAIYISSILVGERKTQIEIGKVAEISNTSVGKGYKKLRENVSMDIIL